MDSDSLGFQSEKRDLLRGFAAGLIFGMPLLFTMEIWDEGKSYHPFKITLILCGTILVNIAFSYFAGLRKKHSSVKFIEAIDDGLSSIFLGLIAAVFILFLLGKISADIFQSSAEMGMVLLEACLISIGINFTNFKFKQLGARQARRIIADTLSLNPGNRQLKKDLNDLAATVAGSLVFSFNMAPTEEIFLIAAGLSSFQLFILLIAELIICYIILYASGVGNHRVYEKDSFFQRPWVETIMATAISLLIAMMLILVLGFHDVKFSDPHFLSVGVTLGLSAVIGGAAGRIII